jgi:hypothetical protein
MMVRISKARPRLTIPARSTSEIRVPIQLPDVLALYNFESTLGSCGPRMGDRLTNELNGQRKTYLSDPDRPKPGFRLAFLVSTTVQQSATLALDNDQRQPRDYVVFFRRDVGEGIRRFRRVNPGFGYFAQIGPCFLLVYNGHSALRTSS